MIFVWGLLALRVVSGLTLCAYLFYAGMTIWAAVQWKRARPLVDPAWEPGVTILKPVRGVDADAYENFASYCRQDYPSDKIQILFGALEPDDPALALAKRLREEFPNIDIGVHSPEGASAVGMNRKVCNLLNLLPRAKFDTLVLSDSDMRAQPDYLRRIVAPFSPENQAMLSSSNPRDKKLCGLVTCPYRGGGLRSVSAVLEALGIGSDFIPSVLVSRALEGVSFALGSTIVIPKSVLAEIGGFEPLLNQLADDFRLGNAVANSGYRVVLSDAVIEDVIGEERFAPMWSRRLRWAKTLRVCRPAGYAGAFITYGFALSLIFLTCTGFQPVGWFACLGVLSVRVGASLFITLRCTGDPNLLRFLPLLPVSDLLNFALYASSYFGKTIVWRGERFQLSPDGSLTGAKD